MFTGYQLHETLSSNSFIAITTGWCLVCVVAVDMLKVELKRRLAQHKRDGGTFFNFSTYKPARRQRLVQTNHVQLSSGHVVSLNDTDITTELGTHHKN
ncbi:hypothetical protein [Coraliomargarita akajimensis]|nr:hypothetical protein [Coraliomargarita akajimensis]